VRLYKEIVLLPEQHILRQLTCEPGSSRPRRWSVKRRAGRPKQQWAACVVCNRAGLRTTCTARFACFTSSVDVPL
jgi:hypothetical protein